MNSIQQASHFKSDVSFANNAPASSCKECSNLTELLGHNYYAHAAEQSAKYGSAHKEQQDDFLMLPVVDFAFKLLFGDAKRTERLQSLLSSILQLPNEEFQDLTIMNPNLPPDFAGDKYGILDVRAAMTDGRQINIEIQVLPYAAMPERTLYYWGKMYTQQLAEGESFADLKKCIAINIMDYNFPLAKSVHSVYHIVEDGNQSRLTDVLEIHFLDLEKLRRGLDIEGLNPSMLKWLRFLAAKRKEEFEMLAKEDKELDRAYERLQQISADDEARIWYEVRQKGILDQRTIEVVARKEGKAEGLKEGKTEVALSALKEGMDIALIAKLTGLSEEEIKKLA
jgi:predicted transposase/invertase (TIGR01784 family)